jgi:hypothetical protein
MVTYCFVLATLKYAKEVLENVARSRGLAHPPLNLVVVYQLE